MQQTKTKPLTPFLKWAGGKTLLAPRLAEMYKPFRDTHTWVEPFCGALGAALGVKPERAILSDSNPHLINLYDHISFGLQSTVNYENSQDAFKQIKTDFNRSLNPDSGFIAGDWWKAKAFYYLNRTCFNGLCRFNQKGEFNVGYGKYKSPKLDHDFSIYQAAFRYWDFFNFGYETALSLSKEHIRSTFIYADPPYDGGFVGYSGKFIWDYQVNPASKLAELNCPVVASNKATNRIIDLYTNLGFSLDFIDVRRRIACNGDRKPAREILATRNICQTLTH